MGQVVSVAASDALLEEFVVIQKELFSSFGLHYRPVPRIKCTVHPPTESSTLKLGCLVGKCTARFQAPATAQIIRHAASMERQRVNELSARKFSALSLFAYQGAGQFCRFSSSVLLEEEIRACG